MGLEFYANPHIGTRIAVTHKAKTDESSLIGIAASSTLEVTSIIPGVIRCNRFLAFGQLCYQEERAYFFGD